MENVDELLAKFGRGEIDVSVIADLAAKMEQENAKTMAGVERLNNLTRQRKQATESIGDLVADMADELIATAKQQNMTLDERLDLLTARTQKLVEVLDGDNKAVSDIREELGLPAHQDPKLCAMCQTPWKNDQSFGSTDLWVLSRGPGPGISKFRLDDVNYCSMSCQIAAAVERERQDENYVRESLGMKPLPIPKRPSRKPPARPSDRRRKGEKPPPTPQADMVGGDLNEMRPKATKKKSKVDGLRPVVTVYDEVDNFYTLGNQYPVRYTAEQEKRLAQSLGQFGSRYGKRQQ